MIIFLYWLQVEVMFLDVPETINIDFTCFFFHLFQGGW